MNAITKPVETRRWTLWNPYCGFKSDIERRRALRSRDVRIVVVVALLVLGSDFVKTEWAIQFLARAIA